MERFNPPIPPVEPVSFDEMFTAKGAKLPSQVVVSRSVSEGRQCGRQPHPVQASQAVPGLVYTYNADGELVAA